MRQITNRIFIANSSDNPNNIKQHVNMVVFLISDDKESNKIKSYTDAGYLIKQHPVSEEKQIKDIANKYTFVVASGDAILVVSDDKNYQKEFFLELMNSVCGMSFADSIDIFKKKTA